MSTLVITVNVSNPDAEDRDAMNDQIDLENARRAALIPPGTPLPKDTAANRKASYETILSALDMSAHQSYIRDNTENTMRALREELKAAPADKKAAAIAAARAALK